MTALTPIKAGFLPLLDSVLLVLAREKGFAEAQGIDLHLVRETSWANIRDRAAVGHFDIAQMLAPMPLAATLGLTPLAVNMIAPMVFGLGNNAVTVSADLWSAMADAGAPGNLDALVTGQALARVVSAAPRKLRFGVVHQTSAHNYELRYWLAASGVMPDRDVEIVVLPPSLLPDALGAGGIDGYCVGEPWNSVGVATKGAHIATVKASIWRSSPDKVLGMRASWARDNPEILSALIRAMHFAAIWCGDSANHAEVAGIMSPWMGGSISGRDTCGRCRISMCHMTTRPIFPGRAMRCGSIRRWYAGARSAFRPPWPVRRPPRSVLTSIARPWPLSGLRFRLPTSAWNRRCLLGWWTGWPWAPKASLTVE